MAKVLPTKGFFRDFLLGDLLRSAFNFWLSSNKFLISADDQSSKDRKSRFLLGFFRLFGINSC
jgi:hypothetical protein